MSFLQRFFLYFFSAIILLSGKSCSCCRLYDVDIDINRIDIQHLENTKKKPELTQKTQLPAKAYGINARTVTDYLGGGGGDSCDDHIIPKRSVVKISIYSQAENSQQNPRMLDLSDKFLVYTGQNSFAKPIEETIPNNLIFEMKFLLYKSLPFYGKQRFIIDYTLSDKTILSDTTTYIELLP